MPVKCILTSVRFLDCPVYWLPEERALCWEDRENLVDMSSLASKAFAALVRYGLDPQEITEEELADAIILAADDPQKIAARLGRNSEGRRRIPFPPKGGRVVGGGDNLLAKTVSSQSDFASEY